MKDYVADISLCFTAAGWMNQRWFLYLFVTRTVNNVSGGERINMSVSFIWSEVIHANNQTVHQFYSELNQPHSTSAETSHMNTWTYEHMTGSWSPPRRTQSHRIISSYLHFIKSLSELRAAVHTHSCVCSLCVLCCNVYVCVSVCVLSRKQQLESAGQTGHERTELRLSLSARFHHPGMWAHYESRESAVCVCLSLRVC